VREESSEPYFYYMAKKWGVKAYGIEFREALRRDTEPALPPGWCATRRMRRRPSCPRPRCSKGWACMRRRTSTLPRVPRWGAPDLATCINFKHRMSCIRGHCLFSCFLSMFLPLST